MQEMKESWVRSLDQEDQLEEGMAIHPKFCCLENPMNREAWQAMVHSVSKNWT